MHSIKLLYENEDVSQPRCGARGWERTVAMEKVRAPPDTACPWAREAAGAPSPREPLATGHTQSRAPHGDDPTIRKGYPHPRGPRAPLLQDTQRRPIRWSNARRRGVPHKSIHTGLVDFVDFSDLVTKSCGCVRAGMRVSVGSGVCVWASIFGILY